MKSIMDAIREDYEKHAEEEHIKEAGFRGEMLMRGVDAYHKFCVDWLNRLMGHDQIILSQDRQQYVLTDRVGSGELPNSGAVHAIGQPVREGSPGVDTVLVNKG